MQERNTRFKKILRIVWKSLAWIVLSVFLLLLLVMLVIRIPAVQQRLVSEVTSFVSAKTRTRVVIGSIYFNIPKTLDISGFYVEDLHHDTLAYIGNLQVNIALLPLFSKEIKVNRFALEDVHARVYNTQADSIFNYQFIINAFASDTVTEKKPDAERGADSSSSWNFNVGTVALKRIDVAYLDSFSGNLATIQLGELEIDMDRLDLRKKKILVSSIELHDTRASYIQTRKSGKEDTTASAPFDYKIQLDRLLLENVELRYASDALKNEGHANIGKLELRPEKLDVAANTYWVRSFLLHSSELAYHQYKGVAPISPKDTLEAAVDSVTVLPFHIRLRNLDLKDNTLAYDNDRVPAQRDRFDANHLRLEDVLVNIRNIEYVNEEVKAMIRNMSFKEQCGFELQKLKGNVFYGAKESYVENLELQTPYNHLNADLKLGYLSIASLSDSLAKLRADLRISDTKLNIRDVLFFAPELRKNDMVASNLATVADIQLVARGMLSDLEIQRFQVSLLDATILRMQGHINGLPDAGKAYYDLRIQELSTTEKNLVTLLGKELNKQFDYPDRVFLKASFAGYTDNFITKTQLETSDGHIDLSAILQKEKFDVELSVDELNAGKIIRNKDMGKLSMTLDAAGEGLEPERMNARAELLVQQFSYKKYPYHNLPVQATIAHRKAELSISYPDSNLMFDLYASAIIDSLKPVYHLDLDLKQADLQKLNLSAEVLRVKGNVEASYRKDQAVELAELDIRDFIMLKDKQVIEIDSSKVTARMSDRENGIHADFPFMQASLQSNFPLDQAGASLITFINKYYQVNNDKPVAINGHEMTAKLEVTDPKIFLALLPQIREMSRSNLDLKYNANAGQLDVNFRMDRLLYNDIGLDTLAIDIRPENQMIVYHAGLSRLKNPSFELIYPAVDGDLKKNIITNYLTLKDKAGRLKFSLGLQAVQQSGVMALNILQEDLMINYQDWTSPRENELRIGGTVLQARNFGIQRNDKMLMMDSKGKNQQLDIDFRKIDLAELTRIAMTDSQSFAGMLNGDVLLQDLNSQLKFKADVIIDSLSYQRELLGDLVIKADNADANRIKTDVRLKSPDNSLTLSGYYHTSDAKNALDLRLDIEKITISRFEPFVKQNLSHLQGTLSGDFTVKGAASKPEVKGSLNFNEVALTFNMLQSYFYIQKESIYIDSRQINFRTFTIKDQQGKPLTITGQVKHQYFRDFAFDLNVKSDDYQLINSTSKDNELYYGKLLLTSNIKITGDMNLPKVDVQTRIGKGTQLFIALADKDPELIDRDGVVIFVNERLVNTIFDASQAAEGDTSLAKLSGIDLNVNIRITKDAEFQVIIDPQAGDRLRIRGDANLVFGLNEGGAISLSGMYNITEGDYQMTFYNVAKRNFKIEKGSNILFNGSPTDAQVNITAISEVSTGSYELLANEVSESDTREIRGLQRRTPYWVYLMMNGELLKPEISFKIALNPNKQGVYGKDQIESALTRLNQDQNELFKQVFALLVFQRFLPPDGSSGEGGSNTNNAVRRSVSNMLSQQLNNLSDKYVKGVELDVGLNSYEDNYGPDNQAIGKTELQVGITKNLFNDRLSVGVGATIGVEGESESSNQVAGDINIEYKLTKDGRYRLRAFRNNSYEGITEGNVSAVGAGVVFMMEYDKFKELFGKVKNEEEGVIR